MAGLVIDKSLCRGCKKCLSSCAVGALSMEGKLACVDEDACVLCGICIQSCPFKAISISKNEGDIDNLDCKGIWVFAEQQGGEALPVAYELISKGRELAEDLNEVLTVVYFAPEAKSEAEKMLLYGADRVIICEDENFANLREDIYCNKLSQLCNEYNPNILLFGATSFGRSLAPKLAAKLQTGLTADCTVLEIDKEKRLLEQTRPAFGGNLMATIVCPYHRPQMATVRPGVMQANKPKKSSDGEIITVPYDESFKSMIEIIKEKSIESETIADAEIIVAVGRGAGNAKTLAMAEELAEMLGGVIGCTRPLVDTGLCEYKYQIGQTGCSVAPKLLISCGISGAIQHLAGIANAENIIAINNDKDAAVFNVADYKIVGDCTEVLKELINSLKTAKH